MRARAALAPLLLFVTITAASSAPARPAAPSQQSPQDLRAQFRALQSPAIIGVVDRPAPLAVGRATLETAAGTRVYVMAAGSRPCGVVIDGPVTLVYAVEDRLSAPIARRNLKRADGVTVVETNGTLRVTFALRGAAIWSWDLDPGAWSRQPDAPLPQWVTELMGRRRSSNPERDMLGAAWNGGRGYRWALLRGSGDDFELDVDPQPAAQMESLARLYRAPSGSPIAGQSILEPLISQPIGRPWWQGEQVDFASVDTEIAVANDTGNHAKVTTRTRIEALRAGLQLLALSHSSERFDRGGARPFKIANVTVDDTPASFLHRQGSLLVALPRPLAKGESVALDVRSEGDILVRPLGDNYWRLDGGWYPRPGNGGVERAEVRVTVETPAPFVPIAPGEIVSRGTESGRHRVVTRLKAPMGMAMVAAGKYSIQTEEDKGARLHIATYAGGRKDEARRLAKIVFAVRGCFEDWLGVPYPFQDLQVIEINQWGWGQAPPGAIFITTDALVSRAETKMLGVQELTRTATDRVAHEVAHAWFPHVVKIQRAEENWLSESFAEYTSAVCLQQVTDGGGGKHRFERNLSGWKTDARDAGEGASIYLASHLTNTESDGRAWQNLLYGRGPLVLHAIRQELAKIGGSEKEGDRLFLTWIRSIARNFTFKPAETRHLIGILNQLTNRNWQPWFERYVYGTEVPAID